MSKTFNAGTGGSTLHQHPQQRRMRSSFTRAWIFWANGLIVAIAVILGYRAGAPAQHFGESGFTTWVSGAQLLAISSLSWKIWSQRDGRLVRGGWREPSLLWALIAVGFLFLTIDELVQIHEQLDQWVHSLLGITETAITDRLDDALVAGYAVLGLGVLFGYRAELRLLRRALSLIVLGFVLLLAMIFLDMLFRNDWASAVEESLKLFSEAAFLTAFWRVQRGTAHGAKRVAGRCANVSGL